VAAMLKTDLWAARVLGTGGSALRQRERWLSLQGIAFDGRGKPQDVANNSTIMT
jgi:hypothetical protein